MPVKEHRQWSTIIRFSEKLISQSDLPQEDPKPTWDRYPLRNRKEVMESRPRWLKGVSLKHWKIQFDELKVPTTILKLHPRSKQLSKQISKVKYKEGHLGAPSNQRKCFKVRSALNLTPHERKTTKYPDTVHPRRSRRWRLIDSACHYLFDTDLTHLCDYDTTQAHFMPDCISDIDLTHL